MEGWRDGGREGGRRKRERGCEVAEQAAPARSLPDM